MKISKKLIIVLSWVILASAVLYFNYIPANIPAPLNRPLREFPVQIGEWRGSDKKVPDYPESAVGADDILLREYIDESGNSIEFSMYYFKYTDDQKAPQPPQTSWIGIGWAFRGLGEERLAAGGDGRPAIAVKKFLAELRGRKAILYYAYSINGRFVTDYSEFRAATAWDSIIKRKSSALYVQLVSRETDPSVAGEEHRMNDFLSKALAIAEKEFLP